MENNKNNNNNNSKKFIKNVSLASDIYWWFRRKYMLSDFGGIDEKELWHCCLRLAFNGQVKKSLFGWRFNKNKEEERNENN